MRMENAVQKWEIENEEYPPKHIVVRGLASDHDPAPIFADVNPYGGAYARWASRHQYIATFIYWTSVVLFGIFGGAAKLCVYVLTGLWGLVSAWFSLFARHPVVALLFLALLPQLGMMASKKLQQSTYYRTVSHAIGLPIDAPAVMVKNAAIKIRR